MHCCPKSFKTTLNRTFSCALLSGASKTTLYRVFSCTMLFDAYCTTLHRIFICPRVSPGQEKHFIGKTLGRVVFEAPVNTAEEKILFNVVLILLGQPLHR